VLWRYFKMMEQSRHRSVETVRGYIGGAEIFKELAGSGRKAFPITAPQAHDGNLRVDRLRRVGGRPNADLGY
jgi:hypothetical protein